METAVTADAPPPSPAAAAAPEQPLVTWDTRIHLLNNPSIWSSMLLVFGIPSVLLGVLVGFVAKRADLALLIPLGAMAVMLTLFVVIAAVIDLFGGFRVTFLVTTAGVRSRSGKGARAASTAAVAVGVLTGSAAAAGAGLLARSEQDVFIPWADVSRVKVHDRRRVATVRGGFLDKPIALYATPETFPQLVAILHERAAGKGA